MSPTQKDVYAEKVNRELRQAFPTLPATTEMVRQTEEDRNFAATLGPEIIGAVTRHYVNRSLERKWVIKAARPVEGHVLLWIEFPQVDDGADHLIYSVPDGTVVGTFSGGYLG